MKDGIKACVNAPSANIRRKRFGNLNAIMNISDHAEAPRAEVISTSRTNPVIRDIKIPKLFVKMDFNCMMLFSFKLMIF